VADKAGETQADRELLIELDKDFRAALDHPTWVNARKEAVIDHKYREGEQWTAEELGVLRNRRQPPTVNNQVSVTINRLVGGFVTRNTKTVFRARNPSGEDTAGVLNDLFRHIKQSNRLEFEERDQFRDGATSGFGALKAEVIFDELFQPHIVLRRISSFECFPDPWSRAYDWNEDALFIAHAKYMDFPEAAALHPAHREELLQMASGDSFEGLLGGVEGFRNTNYLDLDSDGRPRRIRIVELWKKRKEREELLVVYGPDGLPQVFQPTALDSSARRAIAAAGHRVQEISRVKVTMHQAQFAGGVLLEHKVDPHSSPLFPFVPFWVDRRENGEPFSMIRIARPLQDVVNKRESKAMHLINTNRATYEQGAIEDKTILAEEMAKADGQIEVARGYFERFRLDNNLQLADSQFAMHQQAQVDFRRVTGVNPESLGEKSEVRSGVGIARKQAASEAIMSPVYDEYRRTREITARLVLHLIRAYYTTEKTFLVTDELNNRKPVHLGPQNLSALKTELYDTAIEEAPDQTTRQQEQLQILGDLITRIPANDPRTLLLLRLSDIRDKDATIQQFQQMMTPPPPAPKYSVAIQWDALSSTEKMAFAKQLGMQELAQAEAMQPTRTNAEMRQETEGQKATISAQAAMRQAALRAETDLRKEGMRAATTVASAKRTEEA
jgi:hypothetical protein